MLRHRIDIWPLLSHGVYFTLLGLAFMPTVAIASWESAPLLLALAFTAFQGGVQTHNAMHSPIFHRPSWNRAYQIVLSLIYGHPVSWNVPAHNLGHHKHTQSQRDVMRTSKVRFQPHLLNGLFFFFVVAPGLVRDNIAYVRAMRMQHARWFRQAMIETAVVAAATLALFVLDWKKALVFWVVPHLFAEWSVVSINVLQHDGCDHDSRFNHSRNFVGRWINLCTFNNGFHTIHHMRPNLHWSLLPAAHAREVAPFIHPNLDQPSVVRYLLRTFLGNRRESFDGHLLVVPDAGPDESWIPSPRQTRRDLGAEAL